MSLHSSFNFFQNFQSDAHTSPLKMTQNKKIVIFLTSSGQSPRLLVCSNLAIWGFLGTLDKCLCTLVSIFPKFSVWGPHQPSKNGTKPKNYDFCDIVWTKSLVVGLFKFGHMSFLGTPDKCPCTQISIFLKFWGLCPDQSFKNDPEPKKCHFCEIVRSNSPVPGLFIFGHEYFLGLS